MSTKVLRMSLADVARSSVHNHHMAFKLFAGAAVACFGGLAVTYVNQSSPDLDRYVAEARRRADAAGSSLDVNKFPTAEELKKGFGAYAAAVGDHLRQSLRPAQGRKLRLEALHEPTHGTYDFVVVGGGIIGTAIARQLLLEYPTKTVCLLEKEAALAQHQSSHNSGVIHAGIYSDPQLLITGLCVRGGRMMYEFCEKAGVPCKRVGKLVVAFREDQVPALDVFKRNAETAGQTGLQIIHGREAIKALEPAVEGLAALVSNETGIADFAALTRRMGREILGEAPFTKLSSATRKIQWSTVEAAASQKARRGSILFRKEVVGLDDLGPVVKLSCKEPGQDGPVTSVNARVVITAAGVHMDTVSRLAGGRHDPSLTVFRGRYWQLIPSKATLVTRNIYPVPPFSGDVGVHFTPTVDESRGPAMIVGPSFSLSFAKEGYRPSNVDAWYVASTLTSRRFWTFAWTLGYTSISAQLMRDLSKARFVHEAQQLVPGVTAEDFVESYCGVMPHSLNIETGRPLRDFMFEITSAVRHPVLAALEEFDNTLRRPIPRVINVRNAPSPGGTSSLAIAEHVASLVERDLQSALA
jgi:2-hydroxyglutarate dehydrogenase